jgi:hypothetical protein
MHQHKKEAENNDESRSEEEEAIIQLLRIEIQVYLVL